MMLRRFAARLANALRPWRGDDDLECEVASHLTLLEDEFMRRGLTADAARVEARRALGSTALTMDLHRDARSFAWIDDLRRDVLYAVRMFRRTPGFTVIAVATLALGIGATTAIFTLIDDVLLRSLPVRDPRALVVLGDARGSGTASGGQNGSFTLFSYDLYQHLRDTRIFDDLCAVQSSKARVSVRRDGATTPETAYARLVSGNYFDLLGTAAAAGRLLGPADATVSAAPAAVVSYAYWRDRLNRDPAVVGSVVRIDRVPVIIVGVAEAAFYGETLEADPPSFWMPLDLDRRLDPSRSVIDSADVHWLYLMGRLGRNQNRTQAQARITAALQNWLAAREGANPSDGTRSKISKTRIDLTPGEAGIRHARREYASALQLLLAISAAVLLIACANLANLLLARGAARENEQAIRRAIGASRGRLIRQALAESLTLALAGGALGLLVASWGVELLLALVFRGSEYVPFSTSADMRVLGFAFALSCAAALTFGLLPAIRGTTDVAARHTRRFAWGNALIVVQVATSLVVLAAAGALVRSLDNLAAQPFGFNPDRVLVFDVEPARAGYTVDRLGPLYRELFARLNALPGVRSAAFSYYSPFNGCCWKFSIATERPMPHPDERTSAMLNRVSPRYFETLGTKLVIGRTIDDRDVPASARVAVVNEAFVRRYLTAGDPIGSRFGIGDDKDRHDLEVVGVVEDAKYDSPRDAHEPMAFLPLLQRRADDDADATRSHFIRTIEVRTAGDSARTAAAVRQTLAAIDPDLSVFRVATLPQQVGSALSGEQAVATLAAFFGAAALALTCVGLYGLTAYSVQRRTREIGIRVALGAGRFSVVAMIVREILTRAGLGTIVGIPASFAALGVIRSALYGVGPLDAKDASLAAAALVVCLVAAGVSPARRASRIEPAEALRHE